MKIKRFAAKSMSEALARVKEELGEDAVILHSRRVETQSPFGVARGMIEVTAAVEDGEPLPQVTERGRDFARAERRSQTVLAAGLSETARRPGGDDGLEELRREVAALKEQLSRLSGGAVEPPHKGDDGTYSRWLRSGLAPELVRKMIADLGLEEVSLEKARRWLAGHIRTSGGLGSGGIGPLVVALVGPTGVGKTTTIAKLAAQEKLFKERRVGLITADTYRIAAIEQLRIFAEIADLPIEVVYKPEEMERALHRFRYFDLVFIDTAGRSQRNQEHLQDLQAVLGAASPDEIHLVLSLTMHEAVLHDVVERFQVVPVSHFLFTKLDEAVTAAPIANLCWKYEKPVSFVTTGQSVPEDIEVATPEAAAEWILT